MFDLEKLNDENYKEVVANFVDIYSKSPMFKKIQLFEPSPSYFVEEGDSFFIKKFAITFKPYEIYGCLILLGVSKSPYTVSISTISLHLNNSYSLWLSYFC